MGMSLKDYLFYQDDWSTIYCGDCLEIMPLIKKYEATLCVTDPPYNFTTASAGSGKLDPWADLCNSAFWFSAWYRESLNIVGEAGALWTFCNWRTIPTVMRAVFLIDNQIESLLVWDKDWIGPGGPNGLRPSYELVALIRNSEFSLKDRSIYDIQKFPWSSTKPNHPAEKPVKLIQWLIEISGDGTVLDPFLGSGTTCVAAKNLNRKSIGIEINPKYCEIAVKRLRQEVFDFRKTP